MKKNLLLSLAAVTIASSAVAFTVSPTLETKAVSGVLEQTIGQDGRLKPAQQVQTKFSVPTQQRVAAANDEVWGDGFEGDAEWTIIDASKTVAFDMNIGGLQGLEPVDGQYCLVSGYDAAATRNAWAITPAVELEAGVTYYASTFAYTPGYGGALDEWKLTVGTADTPDAQTTTIIDATGSNAAALEVWTLFEGTFTPTTSGVYYFGIHHCTSVKDVNAVAFDVFSVKTSKTVLAPEGSLYSKGGLWSMCQYVADETGAAMLPTVFVTPGTAQLDYSFYAENYTNFSWIFDGYVANNPDLESVAPSVIYDLSEDSIYTDTYLLLENDGVETYCQRGFNVKNINSLVNYTDVVGNMKPEDELATLQTGEYDFIFGVNADFTTMAEKFDVPEGTKSNISGFYAIAALYNLTASNRLKNMTVNVYLPDANGCPGEVVHSEEFMISDVFGTQSFGGYSFVGAQFSEVVSVVGDFFIGIEFPAVTATESNYLGLVTSYFRNNGDATMYMYNSVEMAQASVGWYSVSEMYGADLAASVYAMVEFDTSGVNVVKNNDGGMVYANGKELVVFNAAAGSQVVVTDLAGRTVLAGKVGNGVNTTIDTNLNKGIYIVTVNGKATKVAIR